MTDARRAGVAALLVLLAGGALLAALPQLGVVRLAGVGIRSWYGALAAPAVATAIAILVMLRARVAVPPIAAWAGPALLASIAVQVFVGEPAAASVALLAGVAPLLALLAAPWLPALPRDPVSRALTAFALALLLRAHLLVLADLAPVFGGERWHGVALGAAVAMAPALVAVSRRRATALALGVSGVALPLVAVAAPTSLTPWAAWDALARRPALVFDARSPWVTHGARFVAPTTLLFAEPHRITAVGAGVYRVVERDGEYGAVREWHLAGGESLELRAGDTLSVTAGTRVRFEAGQRVPGFATSGTAWADRRGAHALAGLAAFLGTLVTLAGGAAALLAPAAAGPRGRRVRGLAAMALPLVVVLAAVCWGVYAAFAGPELALGVPVVAGLVRLPAVSVPPAWGHVLVAVAGIGLVALLVATSEALRSRVVTLAGGNPGGGRLAWGAAVVVAACLALPPAEVWPALALGCGLAAAVAVAPALAAPGTLARASGAVAAALAFAALALSGHATGAWTPALAAAPVVLAAGVSRALGALVCGSVARKGRG